MSISQFPRETPRPTPQRTPRATSNLRSENIETVDLTDDKPIVVDGGGESLPSRSSSQELFDEERVVLWTPAAARRPEPLSANKRSPLKSGRKRKSDDISSDRKINKGTHDGRLKREGRADSEEFIDIDDSVAIGRVSIQNRPAESHAKSVQPSIETPKPKEDYEEYRVTETISRVETRVRKSVSRIPSGDEPVPKPRTVNTPLLTSIGQSSKPNSPASARAGEIVHARESPAPALTISPSSQKVQTPKKGERVIQDSDEEEVLSPISKPSDSPMTPARRSPKVLDTVNSRKWLDLPTFKEANSKSNDATESKSRVGSPLRPISRNLRTRPENIPSPFQRDSPTKVLLAPRSPKVDSLASSQRTPPASVTPNDKQLVRLFFKNPSSIGPYVERVRASKKENSDICMAFIDDSEPAPPSLADERRALLDMEKACVALIQLGERHESSISEKISLTREIYELWEDGFDASEQEDRSALLTQNIKNMEQEAIQLLHISGAIKDGFGAGLIETERGLNVPASSSRLDGQGSLPQPSSTVGSAQVILQTQIPPRRRTQDEPASRTSSLIRPEFPAKSHISELDSPSPVRQPIAPKAAIDRFRSQTKTDCVQQGSGCKQQVFYGGPSPMDYGFDDDENAMNELLQEEQELHRIHKRQEVPDDTEEDYGGFDDDDDDDMLDMAQRVEQRHSFSNAGPSEHPRKLHFETPKYAFEPPKPSLQRPGKNMYSHVEDIESTGLMSHPWSKDVKRALKERFKLPGFRYHQLEPINDTLSGKDTFVLMPTGGGKSLCYQLPAVVQSGKTKGVTIVISPLLSLMNDQVQHLRKLNIQAATLNSEVPADEKRTIMSNLRESNPEHFIQLLYITPEMIAKSVAINDVFSKLHRNNRLARIVIDEAHCVSQWGHDFRPDYVALRAIRQKLPGVPFMALTATATHNVQMDVKHNLGMKESLIVYKQSFNRPNLHYEVRSKKNVGSKMDKILEDIAGLIKNKYRNQSGIIYTLSKKNCEDLAQKLRDDYDISASHFHASMTAADKASTQKDWQNGSLQVVVATIAFGMGIDKKDVRFVFHHTIPKSLEGYYQETGRAGRDGKVSGCYLYYGYQDTKVLKDFIYNGEGSEEQKERQRKMLDAMVQYCENRSDCRRAQVLQYFGETFAKEDCDSTCDNCNSDAVFETKDFTHLAKIALRIVKNVSSQEVTLLHCVDILRGFAAKKIKEMNHDKIEGFGAAKTANKGEVERLFYRLFMENALVERSTINKAGFASQYLHVSGSRLVRFCTNTFSLDQIVATS
jgi:bloom syndrome protein